MTRTSGLTREIANGGCLLVACFALAALSRAQTNTNAVIELPPPETPREFFNAGTREMEAGNLREAEAFFRTALASQNEKLQPPALYNLGHTRFKQGSEELEKNPSGDQSAIRGQLAAQEAEHATRAVEEAIDSREMARMMAAYVRGRGAYRELKAATEAVERAMKTHGLVLGKWRRASGDFKSAAELNPANTNAAHNADVVDQEIARLVDQQQALQMAANMMGQMRKELGEKMKELGGMIPEELMPPGAPGGDEDEFPFGPKPGMVEGPSKTGEEKLMSAEEAGRLLDSFGLEGDRRLPMGMDQERDDVKRSGRVW